MVLCLEFLRFFLEGFLFQPNLPWNCYKRRDFAPPPLPPKKGIFWGAPISMRTKKKQQQYSRFPNKMFNI
jgi:hypothetical protein